MEKSIEKTQSPYIGSCIILTTKHAKSIAVAPAFSKILRAGMLEYILDTDRLGTFSGEVERKGNVLDCVRKKCTWGIEKSGSEYGLASEGSFGPHPFISFLPCEHEILYFIDKKRDFHLYLSELSTDTNYQMSELSSYEELLNFANKTQFPTHALIVRPHPRNSKCVIFKGIRTEDALEFAFKESIKSSPESKIWVETDMRAHVNPSRMRVIGLLAEKLAQRLTSLCPECHTPGWGKVDFQIGLECSYCGSETKLIKAEIFGCTKCDHQETLDRADGLTKAESRDCPNCNP